MLPNTKENREACKSDPLADEVTDLEECQKGDLEHRGIPFEEFDGDDRASDKSRIVKFLTYCPKGVSPVRITKAVLPKGDTGKISEREYTNTDYKFVSRFLERTDFAEIDDLEGSKLVSPTPAAFHLTLESKIPTDDAPGFAKDRAESLANGIWSLNDVKNARLLAKDFQTYIRSIEDKRLMLASESGDHKLTMPYHTRFNNDHRKAEQWAKYNDAWDAADEKYDRGVMLTLTTDPKRFDSIGAMLDGLMEAWTELQEALNQRYDNGGERLDFIRALEFGGSDKSDHIGLPHLHVALFGVPYVDHGWLKSYWAERQGEIVHVSGMNKRGSDSWVMHGDQHSGKSAAGYLGKYLSKTFESIGSDPDALLEDIQNWEEGGDWASEGIWKIALYWATGRQFWASSHALKEDRPDPDRLEDLPQLGAKKLERLEEHGIRTISDVRLADLEDLAMIGGISTTYAEKIKKIVGKASAFDVLNFEFLGAATWGEMPASFTDDNTRHYGASLS